MTLASLVLAGKLDTGSVNGPRDDDLDWDAILWRPVEEDVRRLRRRIFKASQEGDLKRVRNLQRLMLRSRSNQRTGRQPSQLGVADLDAVTIGAFLQHLETGSGETRPRPVTLGWPRSTPSSATPRCATPSTPRSSSGCWPSHLSAWIGRSSAT